MVPVLSVLPTDFWDLREQIYRAMATMVEQPTQTAIVKLYNELPVQVTTPTVPNVIAHDDRVTRFKRAVFDETEFALPIHEAEAATRARRERLRAAARTYARQEEPSAEDFFE